MAAILQGSPQPSSFLLTPHAASVLLPHPPHPRLSARSLLFEEKRVLHKAYSDFKGTLLDIPHHRTSPRFAALLDPFTVHTFNNDQQKPWCLPLSIIFQPTVTSSLRRKNCYSSLERGPHPEHHPKSTEQSTETHQNMVGNSSKTREHAQASHKCSYQPSVAKRQVVEDDNLP